LQLLAVADVGIVFLELPTVFPVQNSVDPVTSHWVPAEFLQCVGWRVGRAEVHDGPFQARPTHAPIVHFGVHALVVASVHVVKGRGRRCRGTFYRGGRVVCWVWSRGVD